MTLENALDKLANLGGTLVSSTTCTTLEIAEAQAADRMHVDANGLGYIWKPEQARRFKIAQGVFLAGLEGVCRIERVDKEGVVYIATRNDAGVFGSFGRYWPGDIFFAPLMGGEWELYRGQ